MDALYSLLCIALLLIALGFILLLRAADRFRREAQAEREARFLERFAGVGKAHGAGPLQLRRPP